jgi:hypothetical protein
MGKSLYLLVINGQEAKYFLRARGGRHTAACSQRLNAPPEIGTSLTPETPAFFDANPELKEAYRKPVKNLPAEQQERAMTTIVARMLRTVMPRNQSAGAKV